MGQVMKNVVEVWDNGAIRPLDLTSGVGSYERLRQFKVVSGANHILEYRWTYDGEAVRVPFPATVLPDLSGVVLMDEWHFQGQPMEGPEPYPRHLRVLNADGTLRLRIYPPRIDEHSRPEDSWIECPRDFSYRGIPFGSPASDGHYDMVVEYDWQTGQILKWINAAPWLTR
jgi:hypothetical protein